MEIVTYASFDPASKKNVGWALLKLKIDNNNISMECAGGTLVLKNTPEPWEILWPVFVFTDQFITTSKPDFIIVEKTSSFQGSFITGQVSQCMGAILSACGKHNQNVIFEYPTHIKKVVSGKGKAPKGLMKRSVNNIVQKYTGEKLLLDSDHAYDALANIFCYLIDKGILENPHEKA